MSFLEIFQPGLRHQREERDRLKTLVSRPTPGGGAPLGIDLDGGTAIIPGGSQRPPEPVEVPGSLEADSGDASPRADTTRLNDGQGPLPEQ